jgi:cytochrome c oxidase subunit 3
VTAAHATQGRPAFDPQAKQVAWWGMLGFILTEALFFSLLFASYFYIRGESTEWPLGGIRRPELLLPSVNTVILLGSSIPMVVATRAASRGIRGRFIGGLVASVILGVLFIAIQSFELWRLDFSADTNAYGSLFWTITGLHLAHLAVGIAMVGYLIARLFAGRLPLDRNAAVEVVGLYWHFVDAVWVFVFATLHLSPYVLLDR